MKIRKKEGFTLTEVILSLGVFVFVFVFAIIIIGIFITCFKFHLNIK